MRTYLLSIVQPDGDAPAADVLEPMMAEVDALADELRAAERWVFDAGLYPASAATVVRVTPGETLVTDGPYVEGTEHVGGLVVVRADDLDDALQTAERLSAILTLPIEVRPVVEPG